jgi:hypothetical protein
LSLTLPDLAPTQPRSVVGDVLAEELRLGRVVRVGDGRYRIAEERFDPAVLAALRLLAPPDPDHTRSARRIGLGARPSGELARSFS